MLMTVNQYRLKYFAEGSRPSPNTVKRWIRDGEIQGRQIGGLWFVDTTPVVETNELVLRVLGG